jgi:hypothetical protein
MYIGIVNELLSSDIMTKIEVDENIDQQIVYDFMLRKYDTNEALIIQTL